MLELEHLCYSYKYMIQVLSEQLTVFLEEVRQAAIYCMHSTVNTSLIKSLCGELNTVKANIVWSRKKNQLSL